MKTGILLCNIGTPQSYQVSEVAKYLKEFLMDEEIINLPYLLRYMLVNWSIIPKRAATSAENYKSIWTERGSPLAVYSEDLKNNLQRALGSNYQVEIGMRYGEPSIQKGLRSLKDIERILIIPLYPQYARATTESTLKAVRQVVAKERIETPWQWIEPFYADKEFIKQQAQVFANFQKNTECDHVLMTYHGLPENQVRKTEGCLTSAECCAVQDSCVKNCYRAQCFETSRLIAKELGLNKGQWSVSFQSRLGKTEWIKPYTDRTLKDLANQGVKKLAVLCPSFTVDCLETLEEIGVEGKNIFLSSGGQSYTLLPCLNERHEYLLPLIRKNS